MRLAIKTPTREFEFTARDGAANIVIGNRSYDDLPITDDPGVSGPHVRLEFFIGKWTFSDQFSNAGTIHNGSRKSSGELSQGDVLTLGGTTLRVLDLAGRSGATAGLSNAPASNVSNFEVPDMPKADTSWPPPGEAKPAFSSNDPGSLMAANVSSSLAVPPSAPLHTPAVAELPAGNPADMSRAQLVDLLFAALVEAAKREDGLDVNDAEELNEYRQLAERGVAGTTPARVAWVYVPLLVTGDALNFDVEDEIKGELEGEVGDLTEGERKIYDFLLAEAERAAGRQLSVEALVRERLADAASDADTELHGSNSVEVNVPWLSATEAGPVHLCIKVSAFAGQYRVDTTLPAPAMPPLPAAPAIAPQTLREIMAAKSEPAPADGANAIFVQRIAERLAREFLNQHGTDPRRDAGAAKRLNEAAHKAVVELEHSKTTQVNLPFLISDATGPKHLDVEVHRRHLHERAEDEAAPHRTPPSSGMPSVAGSKKGGAGGIVVAVAVILVAVGAAAFGALSGQADSEVAEAEIKKTIEEGNRKAEARERVQKALREVTRRDTATTPEQQLRALAELQQRAEQEDLGLAQDFSRAESDLKNRVYAELARRYNAVALDVRLSLEAGKLAEADNKRAAFMKYVEADELRARPAATLQIEQWNIDRVAEIEADNKRLIADKLEAAEYALELKDYAKAAECIGAIAEGAILKGTHRTWMQTEQKAWQALAQQQAEGKIDPPLKRAPERPKLPAFPRNDLLPLGGTTVARNLSALQQRVITAFREGKMNEVTITRRGHKTVAFGVPQSSMIRLVVSRPYLKSDQVEQVLEYEAVEQLRNMPDDAQLGLLWAAPDKTTADWLGIMHFCFDRGFADKAGEAALQIRWLEPEKTRELDELLAAKWSKPIPSGGFPERDGRVVPE